MSTELFSHTKWGIPFQFHVDSGTNLVPHPRVGHTAHAWSDKNNQHQPPKILLVGGANPGIDLNEVLLFDVDSLQYSSTVLPGNLTGPGLARYEHTSALLDDKRLIIFGGATPMGPLNDLLRFTLLPGDLVPGDHSPPARLTLEENTASQFEHEARTQHGSACLTEFNQMVIFSGAGLGSQPVSDSNVHLYDISENRWSIVNSSGSAPSPRFGHLSVYVRTDESITIDSARIPSGTLYVHGGMAESEFFSDMFQLTFNKADDGTITGIWRIVEYSSEPSCTKADQENSRCSFMRLVEQRGVNQCSTNPCPRAAHGGVYLHGDSTHRRPCGSLYIFGGVSASGALNDLYCFDMGANQWTEIKLTGPQPGPRLDFACCLLTLHCKNYVMCSETTGDKTESDNPSATCRHYLFIHGGMDTEGNLFNDGWAILLAEERKSCAPLPIDTDT